MKVLLGIGGSEDSFRALSWAIDRVEDTGDDLTVAIVENPDSDPVPDDIEERVRAELDRSGVEATVRHTPGDAGSRLVEIAETEGFDEIVLGGGEQSPMGKIRLGSITEFVILNAQVSVVLVR